jgi:hypothetical protein
VCKTLALPKIIRPELNGLAVKNALASLLLKMLLHKLEYLSLHSLIFTTKVGTHKYFMVLSYEAMIKIIRPEWNGLLEANARAYLSASPLTKK